MTAFGHETARAITEVLNRASLLQDAIDGGQPEIMSCAQRDLNALLAAAERIEGWGRFALDRIRRDKRNRRNVSLNVIVTELVDPFRRVLEDQSIEIRLDLPPNIPDVRAFPMDIEAIIVNLITNAVEALKHTPASNRVIRFQTAIDNERHEVTVSVADSGRGIRPEDYTTIFSPLYSTRVNRAGNPVGTGMGLAIVRNLTDTYAGRVSVNGHSELGGAEFAIGLPFRLASQSNE